MPNKKRCLFCGDYFMPDPRTKNCQTSCAKKSCRKKRKRRADADWRKRNPDYSRTRGAKVRQWAQDYPDYWKNWRADHPDYQARERERMRQKRAGRVAKQDAISRNPVGYLTDIRSLARETVAKQDAMGCQIDGILDYLVASARVAKPNDMAAGRAAR